MSKPTGARPGAVLTVLLTGQIMASMDGSIVAVALPSIRTSLGAGDAALQLVVSGYLLTLGAFIVTGARLGDLLGYRRAYLNGLAVFTAASLLCGLAPNAVLLVAARIVQAAGAALVVPQVFSLIQLRFDGAGLRRAVGLYSMVLALGVALGQVAGGVILHADVFGLGWRPAFLVNVPIGVALLAAGHRVLPPSRPAGLRLDLPGAALLGAAMAAILLPLVFGPEQGWPPWTWLSLAAGCALLAAFVRAERRAPAPLLDLRVLRPPGVAPGLVACVLVMGCYYAFLFAFTLDLQERTGADPLTAGLAFLPYAIGFGTLSLTWARLPERVSALLPAAGPTAFAAVVLVLAALPALRTGPAAVPLLFLAGAGHAAGYSPLIARLTVVVGPTRASALSALNSTGPMLAGVLAVATLGGIYLATGFAAAAIATALVLLAGLANVAYAGRALGGRGGVKGTALFVRDLE